MNAKSVRAVCAVLLGLGVWACKPPLEPQLSIAPVTVQEGNAPKTTTNFVVTLAESTGSRVTVKFDTTAGTAAVDVDFAEASGELVFAAGEPQRVIEVAVNGDILDEPDETFTVTLFEPIGAAVATGEATGTIVDDDDPPAASIADAVAYGSASATTTAVFTVTLSAPSAHAVTVDYATADGTATTTSDYTAASGTLRFEPGELSKDVTVNVQTNGLREPDETFTMTLSNASNAALADGSATGTIMHAITRIQSPAPAEVASFGNSVTANWSQPTQAGNLLLACISLGWAGAMSITPPPGWIQVLNSTAFTGLSWVRMWYLPDAASRSGAETWSFSNGTPYSGAVALFEYAGLTASPFDMFAIDNGTSTTTSTGTTATTTAPLELWFACTSSESTALQTDPTNGFTIVQSAVVNGPSSSSAVWMERIARGAGTASTGTTLVLNGEWAAGIATFK